MKRAWAGAALVALAGESHAHGFGQRYDLPLPLALYTSGAAFIVLVSCVMFALFLRAAPRTDGGVQLDLLATRAGRALASPPALAVIRLVAVAVYLLLLFAGFFGKQDAFHNIVPVTVWALWWVGLAYFSALAGDLWKIANPLDTCFALAARILARRRGHRPRRRIALPDALGAWPAVVLYLAFLWLEVAWEGSDSPRSVAWVIAAYSMVTWTGMGLFGREAWLERGEVFAIVFGVIARFSPMHVTLRERQVAEWRLRPYAVGLLAREPLDASRIAIVITLLAAVSFDGFLETPAWAALVEGLEEASWPRTAALLAAPLLFASVYLAFCKLIAIAGNADPRTAPRIAGLFVLTLVPIAIAYQVAHYLSFLVQAGQYAIPLASDPFGWGWNLFGTANYFARFGIVDARLVWIVSVVAIVAGHVAAIYLGHMLSLREFADRRAAVRSQWPMLVLMVSYTMLSLWIIAQPIVTTK